MLPKSRKISTTLCPSQPERFKATAPRKPPPAPPSAEKLARFIESIISQSDERIQFVDEDLVTGAVIVLFEDGSRFTITVARSD